MDDRGIPAWLRWAREIQALSQTGLHYSQDHFNTERYQRLMEIAAEIMSLHTSLDKTEVLENLLLQPGYATPKVDVRGAVVQEGKILLVQERSDKAWCLPGGWADVGEAPSAMVEREVREESGFSVKACRVIGVYDANRSGRPRTFYHAYKLVFFCQLVGGTARPSIETQAVDFFTFDDLPPLSSERTNQRHLEDIATYMKDPDRQPFFD
jgi:ADP-ribose pyrophosphatase YjhB (NUDIX family)